MNENSIRLSAPAQHALPKVAAVFITGLLLAAGCSKTDAPAVKSNDAKREPAKAAEAPKPEPPVVQEALKLATKLAQDHWVIQEEVWFGHAGNSLTLMTSDAQFKPVTSKIVPEEISEADKLNGIEWHGAVNFSAPAYRVKANDGNWTDWQSWDQRTFWSVALEKRNGSWTGDEQKLLVSRSGGGPGQVEIGFYSLTSTKPVTESK